MTFTRGFLSATVLISLLAACNNPAYKIPPITAVVLNNPVGEAYGGAPAIPTNASGAFYAINDVVINGGQTTTVGAAFAWFQNDTATAQAGVVSCGGDSLVTQIPNSGTVFPWYETTQSEVNGFSNTVTWYVGGSNVVAGLTYIDSTSFPVVTNYNLAASISASSPLTVNFAVTNPFDVIVFTLGGSKGVVHQTSTTSGSVTFSVAQIDSATAAGDSHVSLQIMPVKSVPYGIGGKTYYFVKQYAVKQYTSTTP